MSLKLQFKPDQTALEPRIFRRLPIRNSFVSHDLGRY
jgi:hypothetical protein